MKTLGHVLAAFIILPGLFACTKQEPVTEAAGTAPARDTVAASPSPSAPSAASEPVAASGPSASQPESGAIAIELVVAKGRLVSGDPVVKLKKGDRVQLAITADTADELHLHGYNKRLSLKPGQRALLDFVAGKTGRFTYELHHADIELGAIEVYPR